MMRSLNLLSLVVAATTMKTSRISAFQIVRDPSTNLGPQRSARGGSYVMERRGILQSSPIPMRSAGAGAVLFSTTSAAAESQQRQGKAGGGDNDSESIKADVEQLKRVLEREYITFFDPMEREYYSEDVTFEDPMNNLAGVNSYQDNVDMLSGRTLMGSLLFRDARINLHSVAGGDVVVDDGDDDESGGVTIGDITTRWTLSFTFKILPWQPTPRFSGISVYSVRRGGPRGVQIVKQTDYWDSINLREGGGTYGTVSRSAGLSDFFDQLKPDEFNAPSAAPELPYELLRRGDGYEVRRYPSYTAVKMSYERRDEGFTALGAFTSGMKPLAPALMDVVSGSRSMNKSMIWPLNYAPPGTDSPPSIPAATERAEQPSWSECDIVTVPESVVAVARFSDASVEPVVRKADRELRAACERDGLRLAPATEGRLMFAQYDAVYSMGKRRGEVWIDLDNDGGHPWTKK